MNIVKISTKLVALDFHVSISHGRNFHTENKVSILYWVCQRFVDTTVFLKSILQDISRSVQSIAGHADSVGLWEEGNETWLAVFFCQNRSKMLILVEGLEVTAPRPPWHLSNFPLPFS